MKNKLRLICCLICCFIVSYSICIGQKKESNNPEYTRLIKFLSPDNKDLADQGLLSRAFAIKLHLNSNNKIQKVVFSKNTPSWAKNKFANISSLKLNWNSLVKDPPDENNIFILPVILTFEKNSGIVSFNSPDEILKSTFDFDGDNLFNGRKIGQIRLLSPVYFVRFSESLHDKMKIDSNVLIK